MARVEPVVGEPAAVATVAAERVLLVADVHAGIETGLRYERGVELESRDDERRERIRALVRRTDADRLVVLGDLAHRIAAPAGDDRSELSAFIDAVTEQVPLTLVEGNHDGGVAEAFADEIDVIGPAGGVLGGNGGDANNDGGDASNTRIGVVHGHTWPAPEILAADVVCMGHEHPQVRLEDSVGGARVERAWLRGPMDRAVFEQADGSAGGTDRSAADPPELVVFPAFNERSGGTWINVDGQSFLSPFLPEGLASGEAYLLDGTRLGEYRHV